MVTNRIMAMKPVTIQKMMKRNPQILMLFTMLIPAILLTGCGIPSVHPLYEAGDLVVDDQLTGTWEKEDGKSSFAVMNVIDLKNQFIEGDRYSIVPMEQYESESSLMEMEVVVADEMYEFLEELEEKGLGNLYLAQDNREPNTIYLAGMILLGGNYYLDFYKIDLNLDRFSYPVHIFMKTSFSETELNMHMFKEDWLKELINNRQIRIKHEVNDMENFLLTASTGDLQKFVEKYGNMEEAYHGSDSYRKINTNPHFVFYPNSGE